MIYDFESKLMLNIGWIRMHKMTMKMKTLKETAKLSLGIPMTSPDGSSVASIDVEKLLDPDAAFSSDGED